MFPIIVRDGARSEEGVTIGTTEVRPGLWMLTGEGGIIGDSAGT